MREDLITVGILGGALFFLVDKLKEATPPPITTTKIFKDPSAPMIDTAQAKKLGDLLDNMFNPKAIGKVYRPRGEFKAPVTAWDDVVWHANIGGISGGVGTRQNVFGFDLPTMDTGQITQAYTNATFTTKEKIGTGGRF